MAKILVVDDEAAIQKFIAKILEARGHTILTAADGKAGLDLALEEKPDVVVLDLNLPRMTGLDVCRAIKAEESAKNVRVVLITAAYTSIEDAMEGEDCGADEYVIKPFLKEVLIHNIERLLPGADSD